MTQTIMVLVTATVTVMVTLDKANKGGESSQYFEKSLFSNLIIKDSICSEFEIQDSCFCLCTNDCEVKSMFSIW